MSSLPSSARPHLELEVDWGHGGEDKDLSEIADHMLDWEEKLAVSLGLTEEDVQDITKEIHCLVTQRYVSIARNVRCEVKKVSCTCAWRQYQGFGLEGTSLDLRLTLSNS